MRSFSEELRSGCAPIWVGLHSHAFVRELADGTLPLEKFQFFVEQDLLFLEEYAKCLAMGAARARSEAQLRSFTADLAAVLDEEIPNNRELLDRAIELNAMGQGRATPVMAPATLAYTGYLGSLAARGGATDIVAATLPCAWSYMEIAQRLEPESVEHPVYSAWLGFYTNEENVGFVDRLREAFDEAVAAEGASEARAAELAGIFVTSSRLEAGFWDMAYRLEQWPDLRA